MSVDETKTEAPASNGGGVITGTPGEAWSIDGPDAATSPTALQSDVEDPRPRRKIALVGYTTSREETPFDDPSWEKWGMNNLYRGDHHPDIAAKLDTFTRWYDVHPNSQITTPGSPIYDEQHLSWLKSEQRWPVYVMDPHEGVTVDAAGEPMGTIAERMGWPSAVAYPQQAILQRFMRYFTNTVSWQIAHALHEALNDESYVLSDIALFGIDMAIGTEYAAQRPSVEFFLGLAMGLGVEITLPPSSDLLKAAHLYGDDVDSGMSVKVRQRLRELHAQKDQIENQIGQMQSAHASICGAIDSFAYIQGVWLPPEASKDARDKAVQPAGAQSQIASLLAQADMNDRHRKE